MLKVLVLSPVPTDTTSLYRAIGPLSRLVAQRKVQMQFAPEVNWATISPTDVVFMQRPFTNAHFQMARMVKLQGKPLVVDYDDFLFDVPSWNPTRARFGAENIQKNMAEIIAMADQVMVSTEDLKRLLSPLNDNIHVVPNAYHTHLFAHYQGKWSEPPKKIVLWRGSNTHEKDVFSVAESLVRVARAHPDWMFTFLGTDFWQLRESLGKQYVHVPAVDPLEYFQAIHDIRGRIMITPLVDCEFNRAKSNIAWLEGTHAGMACLGPDFPEWKRPGCLNYSNAEDFGEKLAHLIGLSDTQHSERVEASWEHIQNELSLDKVNEKRLRVLCEAAGSFE